MEYSYLLNVPLPWAGGQIAFGYGKQPLEAMQDNKSLKIC
jgi:hypothetical protein